MNDQPLEASKWLKVQALLDLDEMTRLFEVLQPFSLFLCGIVKGSQGTGELPISDFLACYEAYLNALMSGQTPPVSGYQKYFSTAMTRSSDALYSKPVDGQQKLVRVKKPVVQLQPHTLDYSPFDQRFRSMVFGSETIPWGIQFSYPQIYHEPTSKAIISIKDTPEFPNTALFHALQKWMRQHTIPTPFVVGGVRTNVPARLGKQCLPWINKHPTLLAKSISVQVKS